MGTNLTFILQCTTRTATGTWIDSCSGGGLPGFAVNVTHQPSNTFIGSGSTDGNGKYTFTKSCGAGSYIVSWTAKDCWKAGTMTLAVSGFYDYGPCTTDNFSVAPALLDGYTCCEKIGIFPANLTLTDNLGSCSLLMGSGCQTCGSADHGGDRVDYAIKGRLLYDDAGCFPECFSPAGACRPTYGGWAFSTLTTGSGNVNCLYGVSCEVDADGPYISVSAQWGYCGALEYDYLWGSAYWCCENADGTFTTYPGDPLTCSDYGILGGVTAHRDETGKCIYEGFPNHVYRNAFWYFNGCTTIPGYGCAYGGAGQSAFATGTQRMSFQRCSHSFSADIELVPGINARGDAPWIWLFESPPTEDVGKQISDGSIYQPPPPGGVHIAISS